jgi:hypothetical protein
MDTLKRGIMVLAHMFQDLPENFLIIVQQRDFFQAKAFFQFLYLQH